ncbi:MAG: thioesterase, partial [Deltaproteobacteria bacterium]|nr:thioesterase [Deltaproteobacteria bacterium]
MRFHEISHGVYFDDLDAFRILHNARYLLLMERTIGSFWHHLGWGTIADDADNPDQHHLVRAQDISYERPVRGTGRVRCRIWVDRLGRTSLTIGFSILPMDEDRPFAHGTRTLVKIDPQAKQPTPWSDDFRARVGPYCR